MTVHSPDPANVLTAAQPPAPPPPPGPPSAPPTKPTQAAPDTPTKTPDAPADELLVAWLRSRDVACPGCSYNLRDLKTRTCPECSAPLQLQVGSENLRVGPWFLAVVSLSLALGFDGVMTVILTVTFFVSPPRSPYDTMVVMIIIGSFIALAALCAAGLFLLLRRRRAWARLPIRSQWRWAAGLFISTGLVHALFGLWLVSKLT